MRNIMMIGLAVILGLTVFARAEEKAVRVLVWDEQQPKQKEAYENFLGNAIAEHLKKQKGFVVKSARMDDEEQGLTEKVLDETDVLVWWGHVRHLEVKDANVRRVIDRVNAGKLSLVALHSAHWSKVFVQAMAERAKQDVAKSLTKEELKTVKIEYVTPRFGVVPKRDAALTPSVEKRRDADGGMTLVVKLPSGIFPAYRADGAPSHVTTLLPDHPIAAGVAKAFDIKETEMYDEPFQVPAPDAVVFEEKWDKGEHFRSGMVWQVGKGKVFYFRPGHETYGVYKQEMPGSANFSGGSLKS